jgi:hypothetical protein
MLETKGYRQRAQGRTKKEVKQKREEKNDDEMTENVLLIKHENQRE